MMRIDINACFGHWQYWDLHHKTSDQLVGLMDRNGIDSAAVLSLRGPFLHWRDGNTETLEAAKAHPGRLIPMATVSPFTGGDGDALRRLADAGMRGVRLYPRLHSYDLGDAFVDDIFRTATDLGWPVVIPTRPMMNWRFAALPLDAIGSVVDRHPQTQIVVSGPNYLVEFQGMVRLMKRAANVWYEISCLQGFNAVSRLVGEVGADRVLFGTGAVLNYPACNVEKLDHADLTDAQRAAIAGANAARLLGLAVG